MNTVIITLLMTTIKQQFLCNTIFTTFMFFIILKNLILEILKIYILLYLTLVWHSITLNVPQKARVPYVGHSCLIPYTRYTYTILSDCTVIGDNIMSLHYSRIQILYIDTPIRIIYIAAEILNE